MIRSVNAFFKQGNRPQIANQSINLSPLRYHSNPKTRHQEPKPTVLEPIKRSLGGGVLSNHTYQQQQSATGGNATIPMKKFIHHAQQTKVANHLNPVVQPFARIEESQNHRQYPTNKVERTINNISINLDNLQEKLKLYDENNRQIIFEESERGEIDTSSRGRIYKDDTPSPRET